MTAVGGYAGVDTRTYSLFNTTSKLPDGKTVRWRYPKGWQVLYCPNWEAAGGRPPYDITYSLTTYSLNRQVCPSIAYKASNPKLYRAVKKPASCVLMTELDFRLYSDYPLSNTSTYDVDWYAHGSKAVINVLFCDGSVRDVARYGTAGLTYRP